MSISVDGTNGVTYPDLSVQNTAATGFGFKNRIINGACVIDQRNAGASITPTTSGDWFGADRWRYSLTQSSKFSSQLSTNPSLAGFSSALQINSLSAYSVGFGGFYFWHFFRWSIS